jgi:hypothetical protein
MVGSALGVSSAIFEAREKGIKLLLYERNYGRSSTVETRRLIIGSSCKVKEAPARSCAFVLTKRVCLCPSRLPLGPSIRQRFLRSPW